MKKFLIDYMKKENEAFIQTPFQPASSRYLGLEKEINECVRFLGKSLVITEEKIDNTHTTFSLYFNDTPYLSITVNNSGGLDNEPTLYNLLQSIESKLKDKVEEKKENIRIRKTTAFKKSLEQTLHSKINPEENHKCKI